MAESIRVFASATVANVGCAFDVLGFALSQPGDEIVLRKNNRQEIRILEITGDQGRLSLNPLENTATVSIQAMLQSMEVRQGFDLTLHKKMPLGSGLGSSAASAVGGVFAANCLLGNPLDPKSLLPFSMEGERLACGSAHADNVAPCLLGGFVLISSYEPLQVHSIPYPSGLRAVVVHPQIEVRTRDARDVLRQKITLKAASEQWGRVAGLISGLHSQNYELISQSLEDKIVEPARAVLIPGFYRVKQAAYDSGALGCSISGSGPSVFALAGPDADTKSLATAMVKAFGDIGIPANPYISPIRTEGPVILD